VLIAVPPGSPFAYSPPLMLTVEMVSARRFSKEGQKEGSVSDTQDIWQVAGEVFGLAINNSVDDSARALKYPLLRLSTQGLRACLVRLRVRKVSYAIPYEKDISN
jgi:hypothetical protein